MCPVTNHYLWGSLFEKNTNRLIFICTGFGIVLLQDHKNKSANVIVIDDNKDVRDVFIELLEMHGVNVLASGCNGKEGFDLYRDLRPDIVFMDAMMDDYDGYYGLEKIKEFDSKAMVVLVTGSFNVDSKLEGCLANAVLEKPIDMTKVMGVVNSVALPSDQPMRIQH